MFDSSSIIVGLEIGTSKVCAVVGEMNAEGALNVIGLGQARSRVAAERHDDRLLGFAQPVGVSRSRGRDLR